MISYGFCQNCAKDMKGYTSYNSSSFSVGQHRHEGILCSRECEIEILGKFARVMYAKKPDYHKTTIGDYVGVFTMLADRALQIDGKTMPFDKLMLLSLDVSQAAGSFADDVRAIIFPNE